MYSIDHIVDLVAAKMARERLTYRAAGEAAGINKDTLHRVVAALRMPDFHTYVKLCQWLGIPVDEGAFTSTGDTVNDVQVVLANDPHLSEQAVQSLDEFFRGIYEATVEMRKALND